MQLYLDRRAFKLVGVALVGMAKRPRCMADWLVHRSVTLRSSYSLKGGLLARDGFDGSGDVVSAATKCLSLLALISNALRALIPQSEGLRLLDTELESAFR